MKRKSRGNLPVHELCCDVILPQADQVDAAQAAQRDVVSDSLVVPQLLQLYCLVLMCVWTGEAGGGGARAQPLAVFLV